MSRPRKAPNLTKKLASSLLARGEIPYDDATLMTDDQFISLYQFHHNIRHAEGGTDHFSNFEPMLIAAHKKRTAEIDVPAIAKGKRLRKTQSAHDARMAAQTEPSLDRALDYLLPKRGLRSRGFDKTKSRGFDNKVRPRKAKRR